MTKREAKILALEVFANSADILITKDCDLINVAFNELASSLKRRADKLKSKKT